MHPFIPYVVGLPAAGAAYGASMISASNGMGKAGSTAYGQQATAQQASAAHTQRSMDAASSAQRRAAVPARQQVGFDAPEIDGSGSNKSSSHADGPDSRPGSGPDQVHPHAQSKQQRHEAAAQLEWQNDVAAAQMAAAAAAAGQPLMAEWELALAEQHTRQPNSGLGPQAHWATDQYSQHGGSSVAAAAGAPQGAGQNRAALYGNFRRQQMYGNMEAAAMHAAAVQSRHYQLQQQQLVQQQLQTQHAAAEARLRAPASGAATSSSSSSTANDRRAPPRRSSFGHPASHRAPRPPKGPPPGAAHQASQGMPGMRQQQLLPQQPEPVVLDGAASVAQALAQQRAANAQAAAQSSAAAAAGAAAAAAAQWQARQPQPQQQQGASGPNVLYGDTRKFYLRCAKQHIQEHGQGQPQVFLQALNAAHAADVGAVPQQGWLGSATGSDPSTATSAWAYSSYRAAAPAPATPADLPSALQPAVPPALVCTEELGAEWGSEDSEADAFCYVGAPCAPPKSSSSSSSSKARFDAHNLRMLRIAEVSLCVDALSPAALVKANTLMSVVQLPGSTTYMPVTMDSFLFQMGAQWKFSAFAIALGSSYFQRLLEAVPQLKIALRKSAAFANYAQWMDAHPDPGTGAASDPPQPPQQQQQGCHVQAAAESALRSIQFTCIFLATKAVDQIHALGLLRFMLCALSNGRVMMTPSAVAEVEMRCLKGLQWRLGPFFADDVINDDMCEDGE